MPRLYQTQIWRAQIPDAWRVEDKCGQSLVTFFRPDGVGMLRVLTVEERPHTLIGSGEDFRGLLPGKTWAAAYGTSYSRTWALSCRGRKLYVMYSCAAQNADLEHSDVDTIVQSISESDSQT